MTKVEDATNEQLDVAVAEKVMVWWEHLGGGRLTDYWVDTSRGHYRVDDFSPSTNIADAWEVDKPEWEWKLNEHYIDGQNPVLSVAIFNDSEIINLPIAAVNVPLNPVNKAAAYCRGRCICALKACGVEEV